MESGATAEDAKPSRCCFYVANVLLIVCRTLPYGRATAISGLQDQRIVVIRTVRAASLRVSPVANVPCERSQLGAVAKPNSSFIGRRILVCGRTERPADLDA